MGDIENLVSSPEILNWLRCHIALYFVRKAILDPVIETIKIFHENVLRSVRDTEGLPQSAICSQCSTHETLPCPTRYYCKGGKHECKRHVTPPKRCPNNICNVIQNLLQNEDRYRTVSWQNTDAKKWCTSSWELAKCYMPPTGYTDSSTPEETDLNGLLSIMINCKAFETLSTGITRDHGIFVQVIIIVR